jgi:hypothetical protein
MKRIWKPSQRVFDSMRDAVLSIIVQDLAWKIERILKESGVKGEVVIKREGNKLLLTVVKGAEEMMRHEFGTKKSPPHGLWRKYLAQ